MHFVERNCDGVALHAVMMPVSAPAKHLLIDGNNVGRAWPEVARLWRRDRASAQQRVVDEVRAWHDAMGWRVSTVFDGRGDRVAIEQPTGEATFVVAYAPRGMTADDVIEQWVARAQVPAEWVVATADRALAQQIAALGADTIDPETLVAWLGRAREVARRGVQWFNAQGD